MKLYIFCILLAFLVGCSSDSGNPTGEPPKGSNDKPGVSLKWGDLPCQNSSSQCKNIALYVDKPIIMDFLNNNFATDQNQNLMISQGERLFKCGTKFSKLWEQEFLAIGPSVEDDKLKELSVFADAVLDIETCVVKADISTVLDKFASAHK